MVNVRNYLKRVEREPLAMGQYPKYVKADLNSIQRDYWKAVRKCKRKGWQDFVKSREGSMEMGHFNKILKNGQTEEVNLFF